MRLIDRVDRAPVAIQFGHAADTTLARILASRGERIAAGPIPEAGRTPTAADMTVPTNRLTDPGAAGRTGRDDSAGTTAYFALANADGIIGAASPATVATAAIAAAGEPEDTGLTGWITSIAGEILDVDGARMAAAPIAEVS